MNIKLFKDLSTKQLVWAADTRRAIHLYFNALLRRKLYFEVNPPQWQKNSSFICSHVSRGPAGAAVQVYKDRQTWIKVYLRLSVCGSTWDEGNAFFRLCADGQRQYQNAPLGWIWPRNVDRVHLVWTKEIACLWVCVCVCQWMCLYVSEVLRPWFRLHVTGELS